jgi:hypothetical protein
MVALLMHLVPTVSLLAQDAEHRARLEAGEKKLHALLEKAEKLRAAGKAEAAQEVRIKADALRLEIHDSARATSQASKKQKILQGLEHGMAALKELGRRDALELLMEIAQDVRHAPADRERRDGRSEKAEFQRLKIMKTAIPALLEGGDENLAHQLEQALHAREMVLDGRRDPQARRIIDSSPKLGQQIEILHHAANLWEEFGHEGKAGSLFELVEEMHGQFEREHHKRDRNILAEHIEIMQVALPALKEAGKADAVDLLERAIKTRRIQWEAPDTQAAEEARHRGPELEVVIEILSVAAELWQEFGHEHKADLVQGLVEDLWGHLEHREHREDRSREELEHELEEMRDRISRLEHAVEDLSAAWRRRSKNL